MFGSNFYANFGIPEMQQPAQPGPGQPMSEPAAGLGEPPASGFAPAAIANPLGAGPLSPGAISPQASPTMPDQNPAPAAGIGTQFSGKGGL